MGKRQRVTTSRDREARDLSTRPEDLCCPPALERLVEQLRELEGTCPREPWWPPVLERLGEQFRELENASRPHTRFLKSLARRRELAWRLVARARPLSRRGRR
jgi:hypothetical protein